MFDERP